MNLMMLLEMAGQGFGDRVAIQNEDESLTYAELFAAAGAAARAGEWTVSRVLFPRHLSVSRAKIIPLGLSLPTGSSTLTRTPAR